MVRGVLTAKQMSMPGQTWVDSDTLFHRSRLSHSNIYQSLPDSARMCYHRLREWQVLQV